MDVTGTLGGITLNQTGKEMETILLLMAFYLSISLSISFVMNLYNDQVKLIERTTVTGGGLSVLHLFAGVSGKWETLKRGDAKMHDNYGVAGWLNLVVLLYGVTFVLMLYYVFIDDIRDSYWTWGVGHKLIALALTLLSGAAMVTCIFKHPRFVDLAALELVVFILAVLIGLPFGEIAFGINAVLVVFGGLAARLATIAYTVFAPRPNVTFFNRVRPEAAS
jgi:general L-amino acid transport system permease protein